MALSSDLSRMASWEARSHKLTKSQTNKLHSIIGKLEALQNEVLEPRAADKLGQAKTKLFEALKDFGKV